MWWKGGGSALLDQVEQFLTGRHHTQEPELDFFCEQAFSVAPQILPWHVNQVFREAASYVDRVLRGTPPGDLPVQAPTKFELVLNLKTAKAFGVDVPPTLLARAAQHRQCTRPRNPTNPARARRRGDRIKYREIEGP